MNHIEKVIADPMFQERLRRGRGKVPALIVYRGEKSHGESVDDGKEGRAIALLDSCLDDLQKAVGLTISNANIFCVEARTTLTAQFAINGADADLAIYHDTLTGETTMQIMHTASVDVQYATNSDLLAVHGDHWLQLEAHFGKDQAKAVRRVMEVLDMVPEQPPGDTAIHQANVFPMRSR